MGSLPCIGAGVPRPVRPERHANTQNRFGTLFGTFRRLTPVICCFLIGFRSRSACRQLVKTPFNFKGFSDRNLSQAETACILA
jgi:hypothetical protein